MNASATDQSLKSFCQNLFKLWREYLRLKNLKKDSLKKIWEKNDTKTDKTLHMLQAGPTTEKAEKAKAPAPRALAPPGAGQAVKHWKHALKKKTALFDCFKAHKTLFGKQKRWAFVEFFHEI